MTTTTVDAFEEAAAEKSKEKPVSQWQIAWRRLRRHKLAMIGLVAFVVIVLMSLSASFIAPYDYEEINLDLSYAPIMSPSAIEGEPVHIPRYRSPGARYFLALALCWANFIDGSLIGNNR